MIIFVRNRHCLSLMGKPLICVFFVHSCVLTIHSSCPTMLLFTSKFHFNICTLFISMANLPHYCYFPVICWHARLCGLYTFPAWSNPINAETPTAPDGNVNMFTSLNLITILLRRTLQINLVNSIFANLNLICCSCRFCRFGMAIFYVRSMIDRIKKELTPGAPSGCFTIRNWCWLVRRCNFAVKSLGVKFLCQMLLPLNDSSEIFNFTQRSEVLSPCRTTINEIISNYSWTITGFYVD